MHLPKELCKRLQISVTRDSITEPYFLCIDLMYPSAHDWLKNDKQFLEVLDILAAIPFYNLFHFNHFKFTITLYLS